MENKIGATNYSTDKTGRFEYLVLTVHPGESLSDARRQVIEHAEYGKWELTCTRIYVGGLRRYWMRRRVMRVQGTLNVIG